MKVLVILFAVCLAFVVADYDLYQDEDGAQYVLVKLEDSEPIPLQRQRRQTKVDVSKNGQGIRGTVSHTGTIVNNDRHRLDGTAFASKNFKPNGPITAGGNLDYLHKPSGSTVGIGAAHTPHWGTDVNANAKVNVWQKGNSRLDAVGQYGRHFGGPFGTGRPNAYGGIQFSHRF